MMSKIAMAGPLLVRPLQEGLVESMGKQVNPEIAGRLLTKTMHEMKHLKFRDLAAGEGAHYNPYTKEIASSMLDPEVLAHEIGHAHIDSSRLGRLAQNPLTNAAGTLQPTVGFVGGLASGYSDESKGEDHRLRDAGIGAGLSAPQLGYEAGASIKGHQLLRDVGASPQELSHYRKTLGKAWGTYALQPVAGAINYGIGRHLGRLGAKSDAKAKETNMKKMSNLDSVMFAAMADELQHIQKEKVAINLAPAMGVLQNVGGAVARAAPRAISALEGVGGHVVRGIEQAGGHLMGAASPMARQLGQGAITGLNKAETAMGGVQGLNRAAGGAAALGAGALGLGAVGAARRAVAGPQPTQIVVR